ncbi:MAG: hypothetical protein KDB70_13300 [Mycobacterium sp.]|nr:hypothetical protein [Mycobacterium sp.]
MRPRNVAAVALAVLLSGCTPGHNPADAGSSAPVSSAQAVAGTDSVWLPSADIPLSSKYHWPPLADSAETVTSPRFRFEELCQSTVMGYRDHLEDQGMAARRAQSPSQDSSEWRVQQTIVTWTPEPTDPQSPDDGRYFFNELQGELARCSTATVRRGSDGMSLDYTITGPDDVLAHGYLVRAQGYCALTELVLWAGGQSATEFTVDASATNDALAAALRTGPRCT